MASAVMTWLFIFALVTQTSVAAIDTFVPDQPTFPDPSPTYQTGRAIALGDDFAVAAHTWSVFFFFRVLTYPYLSRPPTCRFIYGFV